MDPMADTALKTKVFTLKNDDSYMLSGSRNHITIVFGRCRNSKLFPKNALMVRKKPKKRSKTGWFLGLGCDFGGNGASDLEPWGLELFPYELGSDLEPQNLPKSQGGRGLCFVVRFCFGGVVNSPNLP